MFRYILRNKKYFIGTLCTSLFAGVVPLFLAYVIQLISDVAFNNHFEKAGTCLFASVLFLVYTLMTTSINSIMKSTYRKKLKTDLGEDLYSSLMNQSYSTFKKEKIGNQLSLFTNDIKMVDEYYFYPILSMIVDIIVSVIILIYILRIHVFVGLMVVLIAVATLLVPKMMEKRLKKYSNQLSSYSGIYNSKLKEIFQNFDIILDLGVLKQFVDKGKEWIENMEYKQRNVNMAISLTGNWANCIAHSNYALGGRINVDEEEDEITLRNPGSFLPGSIEVALQKNYTPPFYRNQLLAETMMKFNMIDTQSMGIRKVYKIQQEKYFPMPDYNLSVGNQVGVTVYGKVLDENYTKLLFEHSEFDIQTVFLIDQVQKHHTITNEQVKYLRKLQIIEGRMPNIYLSADIAKTLEKKEQYVKNKGFDDEYYRNLIVKYLQEYESGTRENFRILLIDKLPDNLNEKQKENKIRNLLYSLKRKGIVQCLNKNSINSTWILVNNKI